MKNILHSLNQRINSVCGIRLIYGALFLSLCSLIGAKSVLLTLQMSIDKEEITIGDTFVLTIQITNAPGVKLEQFDPAEHLNSFEIKDFHIDGPKKKFRKEVRTYKYELSTFLSGTYAIPSFEVPYISPEGKRGSIQSPALNVEIKPVAPREGEPDDIRDIKPVLRIPVHSGVILLVVFIIVVIAGTWIGLYVRRLKKLKELSKTYEMQKPPDETAIERLKELSSLNLIAEGRIKEYYSVLAEIIRHYVARRYSISVMDKTTLELYKDLRGSREAKKYSADIKNLLSRCDLVKFAKYIPENTVIQDDHGCSVDIVSRTRAVVTDETHGIKKELMVS